MHVCVRHVLNTCWQCLHRIFSYQFDPDQVKEQVTVSGIELGKYLEIELETFVASFPDIFSSGPILSLGSPCMLLIPHSLREIEPNHLFKHYNHLLYIISIL